MHTDACITPPLLKRGDTVAILSPATEIKTEYIDGAVKWLQSRGYNVRVMPHARGPRCGTFAASDAERCADFRDALTDPEVRLIFCARGGYGCVHLTDSITPEMVKENPKWMLGFSDVSVLHALWHTAGLQSMHASMAKQLALFPEADISALPFEIMEGTLATAGHPYRMPLPGGRTLSVATGSASDTDLIPEGDRIIAAGVLTGGNFAVLDGLASTPYDTLSVDNLKGSILCLEDIGEKIYRTERMLTRLHLSGALDAPEAIIMGQFTDSAPDRNFVSTREMSETRARQWNLATPLVTDAPFGHIDVNYPLPIGCRAILSEKL